MEPRSCLSYSAFNKNNKTNQSSLIPSPPLSLSLLSQSDPKGWVPASVLQLASSQIPLCVAGARDYFVKFGPPPYPVRVSGKVLQSGFNHGTSKYDLKFTYNPNPWIKRTEIYISPRRYPSGFNATISPETGFIAKWDQIQNRLVFVHLEGTKSQKFEITITKETSRNFVPLVNGKEISLLEDDDQFACLPFPFLPFPSLIIHHPYEINLLDLLCSDFLHSHRHHQVKHP